jgi:hypothetical protein
MLGRGLILEKSRVCVAYKPAPARRVEIELADDRKRPLHDRASCLSSSQSPEVRKRSSIGLHFNPWVRTWTSTLVQTRPTASDAAAPPVPLLRREAAREDGAVRMTRADEATYPAP